MTLERFRIHFYHFSCRERHHQLDFASEQEIRSRIICCRIENNPTDERITDVTDSLGFLKDILFTCPILLSNTSS